MKGDNTKRKKARRAGKRQKPLPHEHARMAYTGQVVPAGPPGPQPPNNQPPAPGP